MLHRFWYVGQKAKSVTTNKIRVTNKEEISPESFECADNQVQNTFS